MSSFDERGDVVELRGLLRERFPEACRELVGDDGRAGVERVELGVACLDVVGVRKGEVVEVVEGCGGGLVVWGICGVEGRRVALVDGGDGFDPQDAGEEVCGRVLWVRCGGVEVALKAADLLLRDGNLPLVVIDLGLCGERELGRVAGSSWFRLRSLAEATGVVLVAVTPRASVGCADVRVELVELVGGVGVEGLERPRVELLEGLAGRVVKRRGGERRGGEVGTPEGGDVRRAG